MLLVISSAAREPLGVTVSQQLGTAPNMRRGFNKGWADAWAIMSNSILI